MCPSLSHPPSKVYSSQEPEALLPAFLATVRGACRCHRQGCFLAVWRGGLRGHSGQGGALWRVLYPPRAGHCPLLQSEVMLHTLLLPTCSLATPLPRPGLFSFPLLSFPLLSFPFLSSPLMHSQSEDSIVCESPVLSPSVVSVEFCCGKALSHDVCVWKEGE